MTDTASEIMTIHAGKNLLRVPFFLDVTTLSEEEINSIVDLTKEKLDVKFSGITNYAERKDIAMDMIMDRKNEKVPAYGKRKSVYMYVNFEKDRFVLRSSEETQGGCTVYNKESLIGLLNDVNASSFDKSIDRSIRAAILSSPDPKAKSALLFKETLLNELEKFEWEKTDDISFHCTTGVSSKFIQTATGGADAVIYFTPTSSNGPDNSLEFVQGTLNGQFTSQGDNMIKEHLILNNDMDPKVITASVKNFCLLVERQINNSFSRKIWLSDQRKLEDNSMEIGM